MVPPHSALQRASTSILLTLALISSLAVAGSTPPAMASGDSDLVAVSPRRLLDTRVGEPTADNRYAGRGRRTAGSTLTLHVTGRGGVPDDADAVVLNIVVVEPGGDGYITAYPCGIERPVASNLNYTRGSVTSNLVFARADVNGKVCIYTHADADIVADVQGHTVGSKKMAGTPPARLLDTRIGEPTVDGRFDDQGRRDAGSTLTLDVTGRGDVPDDANAVVLNVVAVQPDNDGFLTVYPCGAERPTASNLNYTHRSITSNLVYARADANGNVCIYTHAATHIVADVQGFADDSSDTVGMPPARLLDTRAGETTVDGQFAGIGTRPVGSTLKLDVTGRGDVPNDAAAVMLNIVAVQPGNEGFLTVYPCGAERPTASNLNYTPGSVISNLVYARANDDGEVCIYTHAATHIVADVQAYTTSSAPPSEAAPPPPPPSPTPTTTPPSTTPITTTPPSTTLPPATTTTTTKAPKPPKPPKSGFVHPGVLVDGAQLAEVRGHVAAGREPWKSAFDTAKRSWYGSLSYTPHSVPIIRAASSGNTSYIAARGWTNAGDIDHLDDARAAYTHALLWSYTGNQAHADKAIQIMNAWSSTLTEIKFDQPRRTDNNSQVWNNGKLQAGWGGSLFARSAEIIRHSNAGWASRDVTRFENMLTDIYLPLTITNWSQGANWMMTLAEATVAIGVFTNDPNAFNAGIDEWRNKLPATIYHPSDGANPIAPDPGMSHSTVHALWGTPDRYVPGLQQETLRDLSHMAMGLGAMTNTAETARIQGVDLYSQHGQRIITGYETNARYVNDYLDELNRRGGSEPSSNWRPDNWVGNDFSTGGTAYKSGWEIAHHHYTTSGTPMPQTSRLATRLRTTGGNQPALHMTWETLTHAP